MLQRSVCRRLTLTCPISSQARQPACAGAPQPGSHSLIRGAPAAAEAAKLAADHLWWTEWQPELMRPDHPKETYHPHPAAPRCTPCGYAKNTSSLVYAPPPGCPCTPDVLCVVDPVNGVQFLLLHRPCSLALAAGCALMWPMWSPVGMASAACLKAAGGIHASGPNSSCGIPRAPIRTYSMHGGAGRRVRLPVHPAPPPQPVRGSERMQVPSSAWACCAPYLWSTSRTAWSSLLRHCRLCNRALMGALPGWSKSKAASKDLSEVPWCRCTKATALAEMR